MVKDKPPLTKMEEILNKLNVSREEAETMIFNLYASSSRTAIIFALSNYKSLNLKALSKFIGKSKSTTLEHIKKLIEMDYIEIDSGSTKWGKYYKNKTKMDLLLKYEEAKFDEIDIEPEAAKIRNKDMIGLLYHEMEELTNKPGYRKKIINMENLLTRARETTNIFYRIGLSDVNESYFHLELASILLELKKQSDPQSIINRIKDLIPHSSKTTISDFSKIDHKESSELRNYVINRLSERKYKKLIQKLENEEKLTKEDLRLINIGNLSSNLEIFSIANPDQLIRYVTLLIKFQREIAELHNIFEKENKGIDPLDLNTQMLSMFSFPMANVDF